MSEQVTTNAVREARKSVAALLDHLPEAVWREHKGTVENAIAMLDEQARDARDEERRAICDWIRTRVGVWTTVQIERGEHLVAS